MEKAVIILSGGMDSTTLLHYIKKRLAYDEIYALTFNYGQKHNKEIECAKWQCNQIGVKEHKIIDISFIEGSALVDKDKEIPKLKDLDEKDKTQPPTYVPNRNMLLLSIAASYAEAKGITDIFYGAQAQDEYGYWDCTEEFLNRINKVLELNRKNKIQIRAPFMNMKKAEELKIGLELGIDYSKTWTCYKGQDKACGTCPTCVERINAFKANEIEDPIEYENQ